MATVRSARPETLVKYGRVIVIGDKEKEDPTLQPQCEDVLNFLLPPVRFLNEHGEQCVQFVLSSPADASDVFELQTALDNELQRLRARETGLCPVREQLYAQCFDEIVRQVTVGCCQRGVLLVRLRDELRATIEGYKKLYASCIAFGIRAALEGLQRRERLEAEIAKTLKESSSIEKEIAHLRSDSIPTGILPADETDITQMTALRAQSDELRERLKIAFAFP